MLGAAFGPMGVELAVKMKRLRLEYSIAIYHRSTPGGVAGAAYGGDEAAPAPLMPRPGWYPLRHDDRRRRQVRGAPRAPGRRTRSAPRAHRVPFSRPQRLARAVGGASHAGRGARSARDAGSARGAGSGSGRGGAARADSALLAAARPADDTLFDETLAMIPWPTGPSPMSCRRTPNRRGSGSETSRWPTPQEDTPALVILTLAAIGSTGFLVYELARRTAPIAVLSSAAFVTGLATWRSRSCAPLPLTSPAPTAHPSAFLLAFIGGMAAIIAAASFAGVSCWSWLWASDLGLRADGAPDRAAAPPPSLPCYTPVRAAPPSSRGLGTRPFQG